ncbi:MAG: hypothetical protein ACOYJQ_12390 [Pseudochelatococcus sp.]|uniref:hypothetical protein n=1 Tax=Pseudochelatococcus sp. TaxID=2020869 RepID=UPI003D94AFD2
MNPGADGSLLGAREDREIRAFLQDEVLRLLVDGLARRRIGFGQPLVQQFL